MASRRWIYMAQPFCAEGPQGEARRDASPEPFARAGFSEVGAFGSILGWPCGPSDVGTLVCEPHRRLSRRRLLLVKRTQFAEAGTVLRPRIQSRFCRGVCKRKGGSSTHRRQAKLPAGLQSRLEQLSGASD